MPACSFRGSADRGSPDPGFVLNYPEYLGSKILAAGDNFGCGSSREHAVWALADYGFEVVVAPSFADIFYGNCFKNGVLPVRLSSGDIERVCGTKSPVGVNLETQEVELSDALIPFEIDAHRRQMLLEGLDDIDLTLQHADKITAFERHSRVSLVDAG